MVPHASLSHVSPVSLFVAWIIAILRKRDFTKLQKKKKASVRREVTGEALHGEAAFPILWWCLVMLLKSAHIELHVCILAYLELCSWEIILPFVCLVSQMRCQQLGNIIKPK